MPIDLYSTRTMLAAKELVKPQATFLRDRYFPTSEANIFDTEKVIIDYKDEAGNKLAPVVLPIKGGIPVAREGYETEEMTPPLIAPERILSADHLMKRMYGESIVGGMSPEQRQALYLANDIKELDRMIDNREEYMAAETLVNNGYILKQYADKYGSSEFVPKVVKFYEGNANPSVYTPSTKWNLTGANILDDLRQMARTQKSRGLDATDLILGADAADTFLKDAEIKDMLNNRRIEIGNIAPTEFTGGATLIAKINAYGHMFNVITYDREYENENGQMTPYIPVNMAIVTAPACGRTAYGAVLQIEQGDDEVTVYRARRVPHVTTNPHDGVRSLIEKSRPLVIPNQRNVAISAEVV